MGLLSSTCLFLPHFGVICDLFETRFKMRGGRDGRRKKVNWGFSSNFIAIIPTRLLCQLYANSPGVEFQENSHKSLFQELIPVWKEKDNSGKFRPCLFTSSIKRETRNFHVEVGQ